MTSFDFLSHYGNEVRFDDLRHTLMQDPVTNCWKQIVGLTLTEILLRDKNGHEEWVPINHPKITWYL